MHPFHKEDRLHQSLRKWTRSEPLDSNLLDVCNSLSLTQNFTLLGLGAEVHHVQQPLFVAQAEGLGLSGLGLIGFRVYRISDLGFIGFRI